MGWGNTSQTASNKRTEVRIRLLTERRDELLRQVGEYERALAETADVLVREVVRRSNAERELAAFRAECDKVGIPYDAPGLVRHHRGNAAMAAGAEALIQTFAAERQRDDALDRVRAIPRRSGTPAWSKGSAVAQAAGFDMGLAYAQDAIADTPGPRRGDTTEEMSERAASAIADFVLADADARSDTEQAAAE